jgi:hypothetical protein
LSPADTEIKLDSAFVTTVNWLTFLAEITCLFA